MVRDYFCDILQFPWRYSFPRRKWCHAAKVASLHLLKSTDNFPNILWIQWQQGWKVQDIMDIWFTLCEQKHECRSSVNSAFFEEIRKFWLGFTMIIYKNLIVSIKKLLLQFTKKTSCRVRKQDSPEWVIYAMYRIHAFEVDTSVDKNKTFPSTKFTLPHQLSDER